MPLSHVPSGEVGVSPRVISKVSQKIETMQVQCMGKRQGDLSLKAKVILGLKRLKEEGTSHLVVSLYFANAKAEKQDKPRHSAAGLMNEVRRQKQ